ncbi:AAA family ATPase [Kribbella sp. NPDC056345]|uniref:ATP-binding protein n=1 Tax=Kribbella sp. NPDC056345 TaxID=3345789 RepID=UPI0035D6FC92
MGTRDQLLERDLEQAAIADARAAAAGGHGQMLVVQGEPGIGKSRLLAQVRRPGQRIFTARGTEFEQCVPFGLVGQLFDHAVRDADGTALSGPAAQAARVFDPVAGEHAAANSELAVLHGLYWLTVNLCDSPMVIVIDDLQWADPPSLRYLAYLLPRLPALPLLVLAAVRSGRDADGPEVLRLLADSGVRVVRPGRLSAEATTELLDSTFGEPCQPRFARDAYEATRGNPLLVRALAGALLDKNVAPVDQNSGLILAHGHRTVAHLVTARLAAAGPVATEIARCLAVLGQRAAVPLVLQLAAPDRPEAADGLAGLQAAGLVELDAGHVTFTHPLVGAAVEATIDPVDLGRRHAAAANALRASRAPAEHVGAHLAKAPRGLEPAAVDWLERAASSALARGSVEGAFVFLRRCLDESLPADRRRELLVTASELALQVDLQTAADLTAEARILTADPVQRARLGLQLGRARGYLLDPAEAFAALEEARDETPDSAEDLRRQIEATLLVGVFVVPGRLHLQDRVPELAALPSSDGVGAKLLAAVIGAHQAAQCLPAGVERAAAALADGELIRTSNGEGPLVCGWFTLLAADERLALTSLNEAVAQAHQNGSVRSLAAAYCFRAAGHLWTGQLSDAEQDAREALELARTGRVDMDPSFAAAYLAWSLAHRGDLSAAEAALREAGVPYAGVPDRPVYYALTAWAELLLLNGRHNEALATARRAGQVWQTFGFANPALASWRSVAGLAAHALGDRATAIAVLTEELELAERWQGTRALGRVRRNLGLVLDDGELLAASVAVLTDSPAKLELAASLLEHGAYLQRTGQRMDARDQLSRALDQAEACGATPLADRARSELTAAGFRPRRNRLTGRAALTASELRVAELAAAGATNREIAQDLFLTVKTIELHLSSTYRKLGIASRAALRDGLLTG